MHLTVRLPWADRLAPRLRPGGGRDHGRRRDGGGKHTECGPCLFHPRVPGIAGRITLATEMPGRLAHERAEAHHADGEPRRPAASPMTAGRARSRKILL